MALAYFKIYYCKLLSVQTHILRYIIASCFQFKQLKHPIYSETSLRLLHSKKRWVVLTQFWDKYGPEGWVKM